MKSLSVRMKGYETAGGRLLPLRIPAIVSIRGRNLVDCMDVKVISAMEDTTLLVSREIPDFQLAYTAAGEATFMFRSDWYGGDAMRISSVVSSLFSLYFNKIYCGRLGRAPFDVFYGNAFVIGDDDIANYFVWKQGECIERSVMYYARKLMYKDDIRGVSVKGLQRIMHDSGNSWDLLDGRVKYGSFIVRDGDITNSPESYWTLSHYLGIHLLDVEAGNE